MQEEFNISSSLIAYSSTPAMIEEPIIEEPAVENTPVQDVDTEINTDVEYAITKEEQISEILDIVPIVTESISNSGIISNFNDYYIRCKKTEVGMLYLLAETLEVLEKTGDIYRIKGPYIGSWDEVGELYENGEILATSDGVPYWHANLKINADLSAVAQRLISEKPIIQQGLSDLARWFVVDESGRAARPKHPKRLWL